MRIIRFIIMVFPLSMILYSCEQKSTQTDLNNTKDSLVSKFLHMVDTLPYYDTTNLNFQLLKAYKENDTTTLKHLTNYISRTSTVPWMHAYLKTCAINTEFDTLTADEAYRFSYESSFCPYYTITTIIKREKQVKVTATVYENASAMDSIPCTIAQQYETEIDSASWVKFQDAIFKSDFWGLKEDNDYHGVDGSSLDVQGYQKEFRGPNIKSKRAYVSRWSNSMDNLLEPFLMLLRICKISKGCLRPS